MTITTSDITSLSTFQQVKSDTSQQLLSLICKSLSKEYVNTVSVDTTQLVNTVRIPKDHTTISCSLISMLLSYTVYKVLGLTDLFRLVLLVIKALCTYVNIMLIVPIIQKTQILICSYVQETRHRRNIWKQDV